MTPRPPLPLGANGSVNFRVEPSGKIRAQTRLRGWDGKVQWITRTGASRSAAERALKAEIAERLRSQAGEGLESGSPFSDVLEAWLEEVDADPELAVSTKAAYRRTVEVHVEPGLGSLRCREMTTAAVDRFLRAVMASHGPSTARSCRSVVSAAVKVAMRSGAMAHNPVRDAGKIKATRRQARALTDAEAVKLLEAVEADDWAVQRDLPDLVRFLDGTGVRIGEACALREENFDLSTSTVEIGATAGHHGRQERTKTASGWRVLALPPSIVEMVQRRLADDDLATSIAVFPSMTGKLRNPSNTTADLRRVFDDAGFDWVTSHTFRRTVATRLEAAGLTPREVSDHLGHRQVSMTQDVYLGRGVVTARAAEVLGRESS